MSLSYVPNELVAHIASYMDYQEVCNFMQTSKGNYRIIKAYKHDKIKLLQLRFKEEYCRGTEIGPPEPPSCQRPDLYCKRFNKHATLVNNIRNVLNQCCYVGQLQLEDPITTEIVEVLYSTKAKIVSLWVTDNFIDLPAKEVVKLCQKFKGSSFVECTLKLEIWTDEFLVPIFESSASIGNYSYDEIQEPAKLITDKSLEALFGADPTDDEQLNVHLADVHNFFTIKEIVKSLKSVFDKWKCVQCNFGVLQSGQLKDAERYFNEETGELSEEYNVEVEGDEECNTYKLSFDYDQTNDYARSKVVFSVLL